MYYLDKFFPFLGGNTFSKSFKIIIISEGFTQAGKDTFYDNCFELVKGIQKTFPFNLLKKRFNWINVSTLFVPSTNNGVFQNSSPPAPGRTAFESYYNSGTNLLSFNTTLVDNLIEDLYYKELGEDVKVTGFIKKGGVNVGQTCALIVFLLPSESNNNIEVNFVDNNHYNFIATTVDGLWPQLIARAMGTTFGLGDEYELDGTNYLAPTQQDGQLINILYNNLIYYDNLTTGPNLGSSSNFKWRPLFINSFNQTLAVNPHPGSTGTADRSIPAIPKTEENIEMWEGGAGFRQKIYRSNHDCLMRRRIGDSTLPVKHKTVPFCAVCKKILESIVH